MRCLPMALIALSLLLSSLVAASERAQRYHELHSQAYLLCANALMYFDAQERAPDPRHLAAYRGALSRLAGLTGELGQPLAEISALLSELERLPRSEEPLYPARLIALLGAHERLESQRPSTIANSRRRSRRPCSCCTGRARPWGACSCRPRPAARECWAPIRWP